MTENYFILRTTQLQFHSTGKLARLERVLGKFRRMINSKQMARLSPLESA